MTASISYPVVLTTYIIPCAKLLLVLRVPLCQAPSSKGSIANLISYFPHAASPGGPSCAGDASSSLFRALPEGHVYPPYILPTPLLRVGLPVLVMPSAAYSGHCHMACAPRTCGHCGRTRFVVPTSSILHTGQVDRRLTPGASHCVAAAPSRPHRWW